MKQKIRTEKVNQQRADTKANASVFLFFSTAHFLKTILATAQMAHLVFPNTQANPSAKPKEPFFANAPTDRTTIIQTIFILKNEIVKIFNLSLRTHFKMT
ncbi:MAG: hypothetical protein PHW92_14060 [Lutibacter sp.]|nr:hypothetical protein [Lutibacter sp.]